MKAILKETGEIVEVYHYGKPYYVEYIGEKPGRIFYPEELDLLDNDPDYWTRLEHQYAGMAMQAMISKQTVGHKLNTITDLCRDIAHALVEKMKNQSV